MESFSVRLKRLRKEKGLTISEISQKTGISASTYKEWERGRQIRGEPYEKIADALEVSIQELIIGKKAEANQVVEKLDRIEYLVREIKKDLYSAE